MEAGQRGKRLFGKNFKRFAFVVLCIISLSFRANAQSGCYISSLNTIYTDKLGFPLAAYYDPFSGVSTTCGSTSTTSTIIYVPSTTGSTSCSVFLVGNGVVRTYVSKNCPLDDYLPLLFLPVALIGVWKMRRERIDANKISAV